MVAIEAIEGGASFVDRFGKLAIFVLQNDPGCLFLIKKKLNEFYGVHAQLVHCS